MPKQKPCPMINADYILESLLEVMDLDHLLTNIQKLTLKAETLNDEAPKYTDEDLEKYQSRNEALFEILGLIKEAKR